MTKFGTGQLNSEVKAFEDLFFSNLPQEVLKQYNFEEILKGNSNEISRLNDYLVIEAIEKYFSDFEMQKNCMKIIVKWTEFVIENTKRFKDIPRNIINDVLDIYESFSRADFNEINRLSYDYYAVFQFMNNDFEDYVASNWTFVGMAINTFFERKMYDIGLNKVVPYINSSLAISDIMNIAYEMQIQTFLSDVLINKLYNLKEKFNDIGSKYKQLPILVNYIESDKEPRKSTVGREFSESKRIIKKAKRDLASVRLSAKLNGEYETYANIVINFPDEDWNLLLKYFIQNELNMQFDSSITLFGNVMELIDIIDKVKEANLGINYIVNQFGMYNQLNYLREIDDTKFESHLLKNAMASYIAFINERKETLNKYYINIFLESRYCETEKFIQLHENQLVYNSILVVFSLILDDILNIVNKFTINEIEVKQTVDYLTEEIAKSITQELEFFGFAYSLEGIKAIVNGSRKDITKFLNTVNNLDIPVETKRGIKEMLIYAHPGLSNYIANRSLW